MGKYCERLDRMFKFTKSNGIKIELTESQYLQLSSKDKINAALADSKVVAYDISFEKELMGFAMLRNCDKVGFCGIMIHII